MMKSAMTHVLAPMLLMTMLALGLSACGGEEEAKNGGEGNGGQSLEQNGDTPREENEGSTSGSQY